MLKIVLNRLHLTWIKEGISIAINEQIMLSRFSLIEFNMELGFEVNHKKQLCVIHTLLFVFITRWSKSLRISKKLAVLSGVGQEKEKKVRDQIFLNNPIN